LGLAQRLRVSLAPTRAYESFKKLPSGVVRSNPARVLGGSLLLSEEKTVNINKAFFSILWRMFRKCWPTKQAFNVMTGAKGMKS
jgi:hypothetical protein